MPVKLTISTWFLAICFLSLAVNAGQENEDVQLPSMAFLEFLTTLDQDDGEWLDKASTEEHRSENKQDMKEVKYDE